MKKTNKILAALTSAALLCGAIGALPASAEETKVLRGDVDRNGMVDVIDAVRILQYYAGTILSVETPVNDDDCSDLSVSDINNDGKVNCIDAVKIMRYYGVMLLLPADRQVSIDEFYTEWTNDPAADQLVDLFEDMVKEEL